MIRFLTSVGKDSLNRPQGLVKWPTGGVLVCDTFHHLLRIFSGEGTLLKTFGGQGSSICTFQYPQDVTIDSQGRIYVADTGNNRVQVFDADFIYLKSIKDLIRPISVVTNNSMLFVIESSPMVARISRYDHSFRLMGQIGQSQDLRRILECPTDLCLLGDQRMFVTDSDKNCVVMYSLEGEYLGQFSISGEKLGELSIPTSITGDSKSNLYVVDSGNHRVQVFGNKGNFLWSFGKEGEERDELRYPYDIVLDEEKGLVYITDSGNNRLVLFEER